MTYDVTDNAGNAAVQKVRTVLVVGSGEPVMALLGSVPQSIRIGNPYIELGAAAWDGADGDLSASIEIDASSVNTAKLGSYSVFYDVEDSEGNSAPRLTRTVKVIDDVAPVITLVGVNPQAIDIRQPYVEFGAQAVDNVDGDLTASIVIDSSSVDTSTPGAYIVTYDVTDTAGNDAITVSRTVKVGADLAPDIFLVGPSPQRIPFGGSYSEYGATAWDAQDGDLTGALVIDASDVDETRPGVYLVSYSVADAGGNPALATRVVEVLDFFVDDNGSIFQRDINAIALAGITRGCNPPQNDWYLRDQERHPGPVRRHDRACARPPGRSSGRLRRRQRLHLRERHQQTRRCGGDERLQPSGQHEVLSERVPEPGPSGSHVRACTRLHRQWRRRPVRRRRRLCVRG